MAKRTINRKSQMLHDEATPVATLPVATKAARKSSKSSKSSSKAIPVDSEYAAFLAWKEQQQQQEATLPLPTFLQQQVDSGIITAAAAQQVAKGWRIEQQAAADSIPSPTIAKPKQHVHAPAAMVTSPGKRKGTEYENLSVPFLQQSPTGNDYTDRFIIGYRKLKAILLSLDDVQRYVAYMDEKNQ